MAATEVGTAERYAKNAYAWLIFQHASGVHKSRNFKASVKDGAPVF